MCGRVVLFCGREIIISREEDNYFSGERYLFRGREIIILREGLILISLEGDNIIFQPVLSESPYYTVTNWGCVRVWGANITQQRTKHHP